LGRTKDITRADEAISLADNAKPSDGLSCRKMKPSPSRSKSVNDSQAIALHEAVDKIMRRFKLEPGMLAGSAYADLHVNDVGLLAILAEPRDWNVRKITQALSAPFSTVSSALDRLEVRKLVGRRRRPGDRRVVYIELTPAGTHLAKKLRATQIETCRAMLARLSALDRDEFIRLVAQVAQG
jgi:DNA-binding MarR family transcriptional regulator